MCKAVGSLSIKITQKHWGNKKDVASRSGNILVNSQCSIVTSPSEYEEASPQSPLLHQAACFLLDVKIFIEALGSHHLPNRNISIVFE